MNKKGFTLQELLITMAIIGIVAAVTAPAITGLFPDENKMKYLKAYSTLTNITSEIINDPSLYWDVYNEKDPSVIDEGGFYSDVQPQVPPYNNDEHCQRDSKYPAIFSKFVNIQGEPTYGQTVDFTTTDGILWSFDVQEKDKAIYPSSIGYETTLTINVNPKDERADHNCVYDNDVCKKPNRFVFRIENDGGVYFADAMGMAYQLNATNTNSSSKDQEVASLIVSAAGSTTDFDKLQTAFNTIATKFKQIPTEK